LEEAVGTGEEAKTSAACSCGCEPYETCENNKTDNNGKKYTDIR